MKSVITLKIHRLLVQAVEVVVDVLETPVQLRIKLSLVPSSLLNVKIKVAN